MNNRLQKLKVHFLIKEALLEILRTPSMVMSLKRLSKKSRSICFLLCTLFVFSFISCLYQTSDRIMHYQDEPTVVNLYFTENAPISFPYVYVYPQMTKELHNFLVNLTKNKNSNFGCSFLRVPQFRTITEEFFKHLRVPSYIVDAYVTKEKSRVNLTIKNYDTLAFVAMQLSSDINVPCGNTNYKMTVRFVLPDSCFGMATSEEFNKLFGYMSDLSTAFGICTSFKKVHLPFTPKQNFLTVLLRIPRMHNSKCNTYAPHFILSQNQYFHPKYIFYITGTVEMIDLSRQTFVRLDTPKSHCGAIGKVSKCEQMCYKTKLEKQITCKLPFMGNNLPLCKTQETAKRTWTTYLNNQFKTNPQKICSCKPRCEETIFIPSVRKIYSRIRHSFLFQYFIDHNIREVIKEERAITVIKLLCNIGGIIGITMGISIFSLIEYCI